MLVSDHKQLLTLFNEKMGCPLQGQEEFSNESSSSLASSVLSGASQEL